MRELRQALAEINAIKAQVALGTQFRGYGPRSIAASGVLALLVATAQARFLRVSERDFGIFLVVWGATAAVSVALSVWETLSRAKRVHIGFSNEMIHAAVAQFLPAVVVGILLTVVLTRTAPQVLWMLPGLWEVAFSLGIFASCRFLPRPMCAVGLWYLVSGLACLAIESGPQTLSPWSMGVPFGIGQLLVAAVLICSYERTLRAG